MVRSAVDPCGRKRTGFTENPSSNVPSAAYVRHHSIDVRFIGLLRILARLSPSNPSARSSLWRAGYPHQEPQSFWQSPLKTKPRTLPLRTPSWLRVSSEIPHPCAL